MMREIESNLKMNYDKTNCIQNKTAIILTGFSCNNNCIMCSVASLRKTQRDRSTLEIVSDILRYRRNGFKKIEFSGGEATLRKDIFALLRHSKLSGFERVLISTNGRRFKDLNFCNNISSYGLSSVGFSIYGHTNKIHDLITRTPGSFIQTIQGIKNFKRINKSGEMVNTVVLKYNYQYLKEIYNYFSKEFGMKVWNVVDLIPEGSALDYYKFLAIGPKELSKNLERISEIIEKSKLRMVTFFDFPLCFFPPQVKKNTKIKFVTAMQRESLFTIKGRNPGKRIAKNNKMYNDKLKMRINVCMNCLFLDNCGGIWTKYLELFGEDIINKLAKKNKCLI